LTPAAAIDDTTSPTTTVLSPVQSGLVLQGNGEVHSLVFGRVCRRGRPPLSTHEGYYCSRHHTANRCLVDTAHTTTDCAERMKARSATDRRCLRETCTPTESIPARGVSGYCGHCRRGRGSELPYVYGMPSPCPSKRKDNSKAGQDCQATQNACSAVAVCVLCWGGGWCGLGRGSGSGR
jgi:hypothetical protein